MSERKLATIQKITSISKIQNASSISLATVLGWEVVVRNGEFSVGDSVIFCEIDSWIPENIAPFLSEGKEFNGVVGGRVRAAKMRMTVSQGLILPLSTLSHHDELAIGTEVTDLLGILKWENTSLVPESREAKRDFPYFIPKTDQERIQNLANCLDDYNGLRYEVSIKLDGSSFTAYAVYDQVSDTYSTGVCSRNLELKEGNNKWWECAKKYDILNKLTATKRSLAVQGEMLDTNIQGNYENVSSLELYVFDIYDIDKKVYLSPSERVGLCKSMHIPHVPVLFNNFFLYPTISSIVNLAHGDGMNEGVKREGIVFKSVDGSKSFKVISDEYLLLKR